MGDPGSWWSTIDRLAGGQRLYRDLFTQYGPLSPYLLAFTARLAGLSPLAFLLMNWIPAVLLGVLIVRAGRPYLTQVERLGVAGLLLGTAIFGPGNARLVLPYSPAAVHALVFSVAALLFLQRATARRLDSCAAGALAGLAFCAKPEIGTAAFIALCIPAMLGSDRRGRWLAGVAAAFAVVAGGGLLVALASASWDSLRYQNHLWPIGTVPPSWKYISGIAMGLLIQGWAVRVAGAAASLLYFAALLFLLGLLLGGERRVSRSVLWVLVAALLAAGVWGRLLLGRFADPLCLSTVVAFATGALALLDRARPGRQFLAAFGAFAGFVGLRTVFACQLGWSSYSGVASACTALTWVIFVCVFLPSVWRAERPALATRRLWMAAVLGVAGFATVAGLRSLREPSAVATPTPRGVVWLPAPVAPFFRLLGENLRPGERVLVIPESNAVETLYRVQTVSPYVYYLPGWLDDRAEEELLKRFSAEPPDAVVVFSRPTFEFGVTAFGRGYGERLAQWVSQNYRVAVSDQQGMVLRRGAP